MRAFRILVLSGLKIVAKFRYLDFVSEMKLDKNCEVSKCRSSDLKTSKPKFLSLSVLCI
jgi:hypothetical protein